MTLRLSGLRFLARFAAIMAFRLAGDFALLHSLTQRLPLCAPAPQINHPAAVLTGSDWVPGAQFPILTALFT